MHNVVRQNRLRLILLLPLLMLLAQQGAWLHQLSHANYSAHAQVVAQQSNTTTDDSQCPTCQSFGQVSFSASLDPPQLGFVSPAYLAGSEPRFSVIAVAQPSPRSRGPPSA